MHAQRALIVERLRRRFPAVPEDMVTSTVVAIEQTFAGARIRDYIPLLVEREARDVLAHLDLSCSAALEHAG